jgi:hypothetical protein
VDIELLDHVILGRTNADPTGRGYYSFRGANLLWRVIRAQVAQVIVQL